MKLCSRPSITQQIAGAGSTMLMSLSRPSKTELRFLKKIVSRHVNSVSSIPIEDPLWMFVYVSLKNVKNGVITDMIEHRTGVVTGPIWDDIATTMNYTPAFVKRIKIMLN